MIESHRPYLRRVAARVVGADDADDLVQETLLLAWRGRGAFDGRNPAGWLAAICRHRGIDLARRRRFVTLVLDHLPQRPDPAPGPEAGALTHEVGEAILLALATLSDQQADAVWRCCAEGQTYDAAAADLGVPKTTVRMRLNAGRQRLRALLAGES